MTPKPLGCAGCDAEHFGIGFVPPTTPAGTLTFGVVGQGPGEQEAVFSTPFYPQAPSGRTLRGWLSDAGIDSTQVSWGNIVQCWLPSVKMSGELGRGSRPPTAPEVAHCYRAHVHPWLASLQPSVHLLAVGAPATRFLLGLSEDEAAERLAGVTHRVPLPEAKP